MPLKLGSAPTMPIVDRGFCNAWSNASARDHIEYLLASKESRLVERYRILANAPVMNAGTRTITRRVCLIRPNPQNRSCWPRLRLLA
jgi:hypothetical protein